MEGFFFFRDRARIGNKHPWQQILCAALFVWTIQGSAFFSCAFWRTEVGVFSGPCSGLFMSSHSCVIPAGSRVLRLIPSRKFHVRCAFEKTVFPGHGCHRRTGQRIVLVTSFITTIPLRLQRHSVHRFSITPTALHNVP